MSENILETDRLALREMTDGDFPALCRMLQDGEVMYAYEHAFSDQEAWDWLRRQQERYRTDGFGLWAVVEKNSGEMVGQCGITWQELGDRTRVPEVGYLLEKTAWHKGYAAEAARACRDYAMDRLGFGEVYSIIRDNNLASQKVARRNGMRERGSFVKHYYGMDMPHIVFSVRREERPRLETRDLTAGEADQAAQILREGGLVGIPTETVYGLGANGLNPDAVERIFEAKGRPQDNPLILHIPSADHLERYCQEIPDSAYALAEACWPGPLTMILRRKPIVPDVVTAGLDTVGMRCPSHPVCHAILEAADVPVAAPSGNTSGRPSPTTAAHMWEDMDGKIDAIVDGGPCTVGVESTIIDLTVTPPRLLRPGGLPLEALEEVLGEVSVDKAVTGLLAAGEHPRAPGMKYRHYAPHAPVTVVTGAPDRSARRILGLLSDQAGVICFDEYAPLYAGHIIHRLGPAADKSAQARHVFDALRTFDGTDVTEIFAQCPDDGGLGLAVANRLKKAAGFHLVDADRPVLIGLTGGTGAGKTSALAALEDLGGTVLDCDAVYHEMLRTDPALRGAIEGAFGPVFGPDGTLDRQKLGNIVFSDPAALERLNAIVYEYLPPELMRRAAGQSLVGLDAINLVESGLDRLCACTVAMLAPAEDRVRRIMARDGISRDYARLRISAQPSDDFYREHCSHILENTCAGPAQFRDQARIFFRKILREIEHI